MLSILSYSGFWVVCSPNALVGCFQRGMSASLVALDRPRAGTRNTVFKSGPLLISSKGIGWKSWKKRWFILTRTSLVFFKNDPAFFLENDCLDKPTNALPQKGELNLTLGGIDLNNSGSVVVREDKKLLTVLFPDGRDGRAFTLKAETSEDLFEWKTALEQALAQAPSAALVLGHNGIFHTDTSEQIDGPFNPWRDKHPVKSLVVGRPILLALEDIDGGPSFLEKALRFLEMFGTRVEGILRHSADVEEVERRVQDYEQGKNEFGPDEDAHVIGDCVKHVLRELPSSPVPVSCCTALLKAYKMDRKEGQINGMRAALLDTFPEPNRLLLQRVLKMMHTVACHAHGNRMTSSAVAACMAPLLLRPLVAGECELEDDFDVNGDDSAQLLAAANAANNAQAIVTILIEEYSNIFNDENQQRSSILADSRIENSRSEDSSYKENMDLKDNGYHDAENEVDQETDDDHERVLSGKLSESSGSVGSDLYDYKPFGGDDVTVGPSREINALPEATNVCVDLQKISYPNVKMKEDKGKQMKGNENTRTEVDGPTPGSSPVGESYRLMGDMLNSMDSGNCLTLSNLEPSGGKPVGKLMSNDLNSRQSAFWGRSTPRKTPSMESVESSGEEELVIQRLEITKNDLQNRIAKEARGNAVLQASLERRKQALHDRRLVLEQDVSRLQEQLQAERDLRAALEVGLSMSTGQFNSSQGMDSKTRAELEEIALAEADVARLKQKVAELHNQLNQQRQNHYGSLSDVCDQYQHVQNHSSQVRFLQQDFDKTLASVNNERKQRAEESMLVGDWRNVKGQVLASSSSSKQASRKQFMDSTSLIDCRSTEASTTTSMSMKELCTVDSNTAEVVDHLRNTAVPSSALVELTTRLDFFKERRSRLMEQLHNLDLNYGNTSSQDFTFRSSSPPPWN